MQGDFLQSSQGLTRREALRSAILLVGGALAGPIGARSLEHGFFGASELRMLEALCETIMPATDTPGAGAAGVHLFIDGMMQTWASDATRAEMRAVLSGTADKGFMALTPAARLALIQRIDAHAYAHGDTHWPRFKKLVLLGYYTSEIGASQELAYLPVPGDWRPDERLGPETRAWAE